MTSYWISDICILFNSFEINPFSGKDKNFRYNALTRLIILTTVLSAIFFNNFNEIVITGGISLLISVLIYFVSFNRDLSYKPHESLVSTEINEIINATNLEKVKLSDETVNKQNLSKIRYRSDLNTDNLAQNLFLDTKDNGTGTKNYNDINSEKYNIPVRSAVVTGAKVLNNVTKNDIMNNPRVSETLFTI
jgi:hypothetical protein